MENTLLKISSRFFIAYDLLSVYKTICLCRTLYLRKYLYILGALETLGKIAKLFREQSSSYDMNYSRGNLYFEEPMYYIEKTSNGFYYRYYYHYY